MSGRLIITPYNIEYELGHPVDQPERLMTGFNIAPTSRVSTLRQLGKRRVLEPLFWSFTPAWMKKLEEAPYIIRSENLATSPMFQQSWQERRCLIPVTGYYLWLTTPRHKQAFAIRREHNRPFFLAGIWTRFPVAPGRHYDSFGLISQAASSWLAKINPRTPVSIQHDDLALWLNPETPEQELNKLLHKPQMPLSYYPVSSLVNDPNNQSSQVASPIGERYHPH